jgi:hypothetical protein
MNAQPEVARTPAPSVSEVVQLAAEEVANPARTIEGALESARGDPSTMLEVSVVDALRTVRVDDPAAFDRIRTQAKALGVRLAEFDRLTRTDSGNDQSAVDLLVALAQAKCELCHDKDRRGVAIVQAPDHREVWMVRESGFSSWLRAEYFDAHGAGVAEMSLNAAIATIEAIGIRRGKQVDVHVRYARHGDAYYIDLVDERWRVLRVDASGVQLIEQSPVLFTRTDWMHCLPVPNLEGDVHALWKYANVEEWQRPLVLAYLLDAMRPDTPFPVLEIVGEQGSAKSSTQRYLRQLLDPNRVPLRGAPKSVEDIYVAAASNWVVSYENLSGLPPQAQDALCTLSTGGGYATRRLYTNGGEHVLEAKRPVMLNGIAGVATRPDLIERTLRIDAPQIPSSRRLSSSELDDGWAEDFPRIFAGLLSLLSAALGMLPAVKLEQRVRMADFEALGEAMLRSQGEAPGAFSHVYAKSLRDGQERALESFGVAYALTALGAGERTRGKTTWTGTVGDLYRELSSLPLDRSNWPRSPKGLADQLKRLAPALRSQGVDVAFGDKVMRGRQVVVTWRAASDYDATSAEMGSPRNNEDDA